MSLFENALGSCGVCVGWLLGSRQVNFFSAPRIFADMTLYDHHQNFCENVFNNKVT